MCCSILIYYVCRVSCYDNWIRMGIWSQREIEMGITNFFNIFISKVHVTKLVPSLEEFRG